MTSLDMGLRLKARRAGVSGRRTASTRRAGRRMPSSDPRYESGVNGFARLPRLAAALDVSPVFFLEDDETARLVERPPPAQ